MRRFVAGLECEMCGCARKKQEFVDRVSRSGKSVSGQERSRVLLQLDKSVHSVPVLKH